MDERQSKWLVVLSALLGLLVVGIVQLEPPPPDPKNGRRWEAVANGRTVDQVDALELTLDGSLVRIERVSGQWKWVEPLDVAADGARIDALVRSVIDLQVGEAIDVMPSAVGLAENCPTLSLEASTHPPLVLRIGEDAPVGSASYVQLGEGPVQASRR